MSNPRLEGLFPEETPITSTPILLAQVSHKSPLTSENGPKVTLHGHSTAGSPAVTSCATVHIQEDLPEKFALRHRRILPFSNFKSNNEVIDKMPPLFQHIKPASSHPAKPSRGPVC